MAMKINQECIACGACVPECPTESISEGDGILYVIDRIASPSARWIAS
jgi:ferredoxin